MSKHFFRAVRDFVLVRLPLYLRVFAIFLIFASPVLATLYFAPMLDHFNKAIYHILSSALFALSAIIFYRLTKYLRLRPNLKRPPGRTALARGATPAC